MMEYRRENPSFSLCGLNCCLCPRFHTAGPSKCPGCGGSDFSSKHPTCAVITCNKKHDSVEYCFQCSQYPCKKYQEPGKIDSFISYKNVIDNLSQARKNLKKYLADLEQKHEYLEILLNNFNEGKSKGFYCLAVNLLPLSVLSKIMEFVESKYNNDGKDIRECPNKAKELIKAKAHALEIELILRK